MAVVAAAIWVAALAAATSAALAADTWGALAAVTSVVVASAASAQVAWRTRTTRTLEGTVSAAAVSSAAITATGSIVRITRHTPTPGRTTAPTECQAASRNRQHAVFAALRL